VERAREQREARYFGRAETLLQPWVARADALTATLRVQADILQNRHDFSGALRLLDAAVERDPRDAGARVMRASVKMVQGRFGEARGDCAAVLASGESAVGTICLAQVLGGTGRLAQGEALLKTVLERNGDARSAQAPGRDSVLPAGASMPERTLSAQVRGWALWLQADLADRRGDLRAAEVLLREALRAEPSNEGIRSTLSDLLVERGALREALAVLDLPAPSTGLLVRRAHIQKRLGDTSLGATRAQIDDLLMLARRRGEPPHLREEALLALDVDDDAPRALQLAKENFATQRETIDARLVVRAARAAGDRDAIAEVMRWMRDTGFQDQMLGGMRT
jgi:tetratricopeptide (TPR) repeat protein